MFEKLNKSRDYAKMKKCLGEDPRFVLVRNICDNAKIYFVASFENVNKLVVIPDEHSAILFYENYKFYDKNVYYFGEKDILFSAENYDDALYKERINIVKKIMSGEKITIVSTIVGVIEKLQNLDSILFNTINIKVGDTKDYKELLQELNDGGFVRVSEVDAPFQYAVRGGIIDIFDVNSDMPFRVEYEFDTINSIRSFNVETKRSVSNVSQIQIYKKFSNTENDNKNSFILDYFEKSQNDYIVFYDEPSREEEKLNYIFDIIKENVSNKQISENGNFDYDNLIFSKEYLQDRLTYKNAIQMSSFDDPPYVNEDNENGKWDYVFDFYMRTPILNKKDYNLLLEELSNYLSNGFAGAIVINSHIRANRLYEELKNQNINVVYSNDNNANVINEVNDYEIRIVVGELNLGFIDETNKFFVLTEKDLFGIEPLKKNRIKKRKNDDKYASINSLQDLKVGDYIIHERYGVGIYRGIEHIKTDDIAKDYIKIEYADDGALYVLATKLEALEKFANNTAIPPKINKIGSKDFIRTSKKIKEDIWKTAKELIELYAKRSTVKGFSFSKDNIWQKEFEETFPYVETDDQLVAIEKVKEDMEKDRAMDRLLCGDVGFGKTEVAIRAAFKAVQDSKQVAYLVPTTILCMQHYRTFTDRFKNYPVNIEFMSRFKSNTENKKTAEQISNGVIDIVIGTHRILSNDVKFSNLGLLIIDEEQRFGVGQKEKIKLLKNNVDVLSLTATPIPRTLYMSLSGIRDMSLLTEAPPERMPIRTYVMEFSLELIREAISRELKRNGQVYIVHNKVSDIYTFAEMIKKVCPFAKIGIGHGKMLEEDLLAVMNDFIDGHINVFVSTTIIETGIDIQNANTLIIDNAEKFGLSQLYQLRGRVGRSDRTAYAFFLYHKNKSLTEAEENRLKAIKENTALGSGFKIAMRDLEMRGAGNILGMTQSGHIEAIGYDMYMKLLNQAVNMLNNNKQDEETKNNFENDYDTIVDIDVNAYIPDEYVGDEELKLSLYKQISECKTDENFNDLIEEMIDRFGEMPPSLKNLIHIAKLKIKAHNAYVTKLTIKKDLMCITFYENHKIDGKKVVDIINKFNGLVRLVNDKQPSLVYRAKNEDKKDIKITIKLAKYILDNIV